MDLLRNLFGNLTSGIIRLAVTAGVLALCYLFIVKPVLDTTNDAFDKAFKNTGLDEIGKTINGVNRQVQRQIRHSFKVSQQTGDSQKLIHCIQRAHQDVDRIQRCTLKY
jgi:hypothetical protein